ncbi:serine/threonine-protein phosphatase [Streptomyces argyrophyllae]|uniref:Serine/threonine-protein phosphatase n=1 Tax=Streptomyces argyrophylli TaxID=2726118 RepID=A0A6M4PDE5_9ACTN|nr:ATP-binding SpoIIE family protein phosphatase [Streptomyces argyrophyllae]QJS08647.1 serine/threonine-protein phosphatase [Streptomyces argyrophyllae]
MATVRHLSRRPGSLLVAYLGATCAVQLAASGGGLVRWSAYSVLAPLVAAGLLPPWRTLAIGVATLAASVAVYGFAIRGVSDGGRTVVIAAAGLSLALSLVMCRTRLSPHHGARPPAQRLVPGVDSTRTGPDGKRAVDDAPGGTPAFSTTGLHVGPLPQPAALELAGCRAAVHGTAGAEAHWLDAIALPGARVALVAGSVAEDGSPAPTLARELRAAVRTLAEMDLRPEELLSRLAHVLDRLRFDGEPGPHGEDASGVAVACLYAVYDPVSARCTLAGAGHPVLTVLRPDGALSTVDIPSHPPLGQAPSPMEATEIDLPDRSLLLLHAHTPRTPGPAAGPGPAVLCQAGPGSPSRLTALSRSALNALLSKGPYTHAGVLAARTRTFDGDNVASWDLGHDLAAVSQARKQAGAKLAEWGLEDAAPTTELIVSELVTNAIRHARPPARLRLILQGARLTCEVFDGSSTSPYLRQANTFDESGRGLFIVSQLAQRWGTRHDSRGKTIWAAQHLHASQAAPTDDPGTPAGPACEGRSPSERGSASGRATPLPGVPLPDAPGGCLR